MIKKTRNFLLVFSTSLSYFSVINCLGAHYKVSLMYERKTHRGIQLNTFQEA